MNALLLLDSKFASRERLMLRRLEIGLADEGARVVHAIPHGLDDSGETIFARAISYPVEGFAWTLPRRARQVAQEARLATGGDRGGGRIDIVHVFGGRLWSFALALARELDAAVVFEIWRSGLLNQAVSWRAATVPGGGGPVFFCPDEPIRDALEAEGLGQSCRLVPWGVLSGAAPRPILDEKRPLGVMIIGSGRDGRALSAALEGAARLVAQHDQTLIFVDAEAARRANLWKQAKRLDLLDHVSLIDNMESQRQLVLRGDLLVYPEALHEQRTILLDAMGAGMLVIAASDPQVSAIHEERAIVIDTERGGLWSEALLRAVEERANSRRLARAGWAYVREKRKASAQVTAILDSYEWMLSKDAVPFAPARVR